MSDTLQTKRKVLLVEDDPEVIVMLSGIFKYYQEEIVLTEAADAGAALRLMIPPEGEMRPDAVVLDIRIPYDTAKDLLEGDTDPDCQETGIRLLKHVRRYEKDKELPMLWVAVITTRSTYMAHREVEEILGGYGRLYVKPFAPFPFENDVVTTLGVNSMVPPIFLEKAKAHNFEKGGEQ